MPIRKRKYQNRVNVVDVVTFDGKNSKDVAEYIRSLGFEARARGVYVEFTGLNRENKDSVDKVKILKGQKVVVDQIQVKGSDEFQPAITIFWPEDFNRIFEPKKPAISAKKAKATLESSPKPASDHVNAS